jgi:ribose 5-phosphate isomerase B
MDRARLEALVRRVTQAALRRPSAAPGGRAAGVHVVVGACAAGPAAPAEGSAPAPGPSEVITAEDLAGTPDGGRLALPPGARVTPLARDEAWRRGIRLEERSAAAAPTPGSAGLVVALGADHGGFPVKQHLAAWLRSRGHRVLDLGTHSTDAVDYPDLARAVADAVASGEASFGVCVDGAGIGSSIAANKVPGVRAALCWDERTARNAREHNFANVLSLGGPLLGEELCTRVLEAFLSTPEGEARHERRVQKIAAIEGRHTGRNLSVGRVLPTSGKT